MKGNKMKYTTLPVKVFGQIEEQNIEEFKKSYTYTLNSLHNQLYRIKNDALREDMDIAIEMIYRQFAQVTETVFNELVMQRNNLRSDI